MRGRFAILPADSVVRRDDDRVIHATPPSTRIVKFSRHAQSPANVWGRLADPAAPSLTAHGVGQALNAAGLVTGASVVVCSDRPSARRTGEIIADAPTRVRRLASA